jgi:excisionase family DNA binding protein
MLAKKINPKKVSWGVNEFSESTGLGRAYIYEMIGDGRIPSVKVGQARLITISPTEFIERHRDE